MRFWKVRIILLSGGQPASVAEASNNALRHYAGKDLMSRRIIDQKKQFKVRYDNYYQWFGLYDK